MKITITGTTKDDKSESVELTLEFLRDTLWNLKVGKTEFQVTDIEKAMNFLKEQAKA